MNPYASLSDLQLTDLLRADHEDAFAEIYRRYARHLVAFAASKLFTQEDAEDVVHDAFVNLWNERRTRQIDRNLKAYLFTLTRYRIVGKIRKNITREAYAQAIQAMAASYDLSTEHRIAAKELQQTIEYSLSGLSPRLAEIYRLSREEQLSISQIAEKLQLSEQTVKNQLSTALKHLRYALRLLPAAALVIHLLS